MNILCCKSGMQFYASEGDVNVDRSGLREKGITEGAIRHLLAAGHKVTMVGTIHGHIPGMEVIDPGTIKMQSQRKMNATPWEEQVRVLDKLVARLADGGYSCWLDFCGPTSSCCLIRNKMISSPPDHAIRYIAPMLYAVHHMKIPRISVINDVRCVPHNGECGRGYDLERALPVAMLSQVDKTTSNDLSYVRTLKRQVLSWSENWSLLMPAITADNTERMPAVMMQHCHMGDGQRQRTRKTAYDKLFRPEHALDALLAAGFRVHGSGWEHYEADDEGMYGGELTAIEAHEQFGRACCAPILSPGNGFYTNKARFAANAGCVPLPYGRDPDDPYTFDPRGKYLPLDSRWRVETATDLLDVSRALKADNGLRAQLCENWMHVTSPDFSKLDAVLDAVKSGRKDYCSDPWLDEFGGCRYVGNQHPLHPEYVP